MIRNLLIKLTFMLALLMGAYKVDAIRTDTDAPKEKLVQLSYAMANRPEIAQITGSLVIYKADGNPEIASCVVLDPTTVLTAAHLDGLREAKTIAFTRDVDAIKGLSTGEAIKISKKPIFHDTYRKPKNYKKLGIVSRDNELFCDDEKLSAWEDKNVDEFGKNIFDDAQIQGVDLAILKLDQPLPLDLPYPKIMDVDTDENDNNKLLENVYMSSIGYGPLSYNDQENGPQQVEDTTEAYRRHYQDVKISEGEQAGIKVLYGTYKGRIANGNESFIPDDEMRPLEALPVGGDSGSPLLSKDDKGYKLAGIFSRTWSVVGPKIEDEGTRELLSTFKQPLFPTWVDVRHYKDWIESHMGPVK